MNSYFRFIPRYASVLALFLTLFLPSLAHAATLNVPTTAYPTIQAAIQAAANGDTVLVAAGTYSGPGNRDIDFGGKSLTVMSQAGAGSTIIDCGGYKSTDGSGNHRGFYIHSGEKNATISGFTVKNGYETYISTIPDSYNGGGVYNGSGSGTITLTNCTITANTASNGGGGGVSNNNYNSSSGTITLTNDIIYGDTGGEVFTYSGTTPAIVSYCDVQGGSPGTGNINADPLFVNAAYGDLHLKFGSPCLSKGTPTGAPATDKDGNTRPNPPSMGAYDTNASANPLLLPVLLVHGTFGKAQDWDSGMSQRLAAEGFIVDTINFATEPETLSNETYIELQAAAIGRRVQELEDRTGQRHICIVCHSMGGLAARYYLEHLNLWPVHLDQSRQAGVDKLILLGTPNWGFDAPLLDPVSTITQAHRMTLPISSNGYDSLARDTYDNWSPAVKEMFAEWQPAPVGDGRGGYAYPSGYKLWSWPTNLFGNYKTTIQPLNSYAFAEFYKSIWYTTKYVPQGFNSSDYDAVAGVLSEFPLLPSTDTVHLDYYTKTAQLLGVMYPDNAKTPGVDGRLVSPFLKTLNTTPDNSGAKIYLVGGTSPAALTYEAYGHILTVLGPYNDSLPNDGIVPTDSALGQDPITGVYLYPHATKAIVGVGHTSLTSDPDVINQVVEWLKNAPASSKTHVLWHSPDGRATLWSVNPDGSFSTSQAYGPYRDGGGLWQAVALATGPNGVSRILWHSPDGRATIWHVYPDGSFDTSEAYGPYVDGGGTWQAVAVSVGPDNVAHILWHSPDGRATLWFVNPDGTHGTSQAYGPYTDGGGTWQAIALATGPNGVSRILWRAPDGRATLWHVYTNGSFDSSQAYGSYRDSGGLWQATAVSAGPDNVAHILWTAPDGRSTLWFVNPDGSFGSSLAYGPYADGSGLWQATALASGPDNVAHILWHSPDGRATIWFVNPDGTHGTSQAYGPYVDGGGIWQATAVSAGP